MIIDKIDFKKYKRFFAFGCSFTQYHWATWADLISKEMAHAECYNYGKSGGGNVFMFQSLMEAHARHNINSDDLVIIMWTNITREDRYVRRNWVLPGNIFTQGIYPESFVDKFVDIRGCLLRDLNTIRGAKMCIEQTGADYAFLSMVHINNSNQYGLQIIPDNESADILELNKDILQTIKPSIYEVVFNFDWLSKHNAKLYYTGENKADRDMHPTPDLHLKYIQMSFPGTTFSEETIKYAKDETATLLSDGVIGNSNYIYLHPYKVTNRF